MRIAILGGTGDIGEGLALRWAHDTDHEVIVGSRDPDRAREAATAYESELADRGVDGDVSGFANAMAADRADVVVLAVPPYYVADSVEAIADRVSGSILVSPAVGIERDEDGFHYDPPPTGSVTEHAARAAPEDASLVGTFHNLPAARLADLDRDIQLDTPIVGDDPEAKRTVSELVAEIRGLRGLDAGSLANAREVEMMVPLLLNVARNTEMEDIGVVFR
ncbi:MAG: NADPH-dependent F420 reductase [Haloarculaceae archaeon]